MNIKLLNPGLLSSLKISIELPYYIYQNLTHLSNSYKITQLFDNYSINLGAYNRICFELFSTYSINSFLYSAKSTLVIKNQNHSFYQILKQNLSHSIQFESDLIKKLNEDIYNNKEKFEDFLLQNPNSTVLAICRVVKENLIKTQKYHQRSLLNINKNINIIKYKLIDEYLKPLINKKDLLKSQDDKLYDDYCQFEQDLWSNKYDNLAENLKAMIINYHQIDNFRFNLIKNNIDQQSLDLLQESYNLFCRVEILNKQIASINKLIAIIDKSYIFVTAVISSFIKIIIEVSNYLFFESFQQLNNIFRDYLVIDSSIIQIIKTTVELSLSSYFFINQFNKLNLDELYSSNNLLFLLIEKVGYNLINSIELKILTFAGLYSGISRFYFDDELIKNNDKSNKIELLFSGLINSYQFIYKKLNEKSYLFNSELIKYDGNLLEFFGFINLESSSSLKLLTRLYSFRQLPSLVTSIDMINNSLKAALGLIVKNIYSFNKIIGENICELVASCYHLYKINLGTEINNLNLAKREAVNHHEQAENQNLTHPRDSGIVGEIDALDSNQKNINSILESTNKPAQQTVINITNKINIRLASKKQSTQSSIQTIKSMNNLVILQNTAEKNINNNDKINNITTSIYSNPSNLRLDANGNQWQDKITANQPSPKQLTNLETYSIDDKKKQDYWQHKSRSNKISRGLELC